MRILAQFAYELYYINMLIGGSMKINVGKTDKLLRIVAGFALLGAGLYFQSWWGAIGIIPLATAFTGWCPLYSVFGLSTCPAKQNK